VNKKDVALDELYLCSTDLALFLGLTPKTLSAAKRSELGELLAACEDAKDAAFDAGATKGEVSGVLADAEETAEMIDELADSGIKVTVEL